MSPLAQRGEDSLYNTSATEALKGEVQELKAELSQLQSLLGTRVAGLEAKLTNLMQGLLSNQGADEQSVSDIALLGQAKAGKTAPVVTADLAAASVGYVQAELQAAVALVNELKATVNLMNQ